MFVTVLHGDNEEALFNIHCRVQLLLEGIKRTCHCEPEVEIELADENGQIKNLLENRHCYASEILSERETCILLAVSPKLGNWGESKSSSSRTKSKRHSRKSVVIQSMSLLDGKPSPPQPGKSKSTASTTKKRAGKS
ncbi:uncharacterized protein CXorf65 homolog isoform X2 [Pleurodeles waltl]|uniref:uncharacterized protein CXorf65 homolog isoform X2 n=1 Tax=Pleurodeles waltl TaxID=8319 RepID=UPI003709BA67